MAVMIDIVVIAQEKLHEPSRPLGGVPARLSPVDLFVIARASVFHQVAQRAALRLNRRPPASSVPGLLGWALASAWGHQDFHSDSVE